MWRAQREDLADGLQSLTAGQRVAFQAVSDASKGCSRGRGVFFD